MPADKSLLTPTLLSQFANHSIPRGIRNNNPGNLDYHVANDWIGQFDPHDIQVLAPSAVDSRFAQFQAPEYGIRAMCKILRGYQTTYKCNTVASMIRRWAPSSENDTDAYINSIATSLKLSPTEPFKFDATSAMIMVNAMIRHETGVQNPYEPEIIAKGVQLAFA